MLSCLLLAAFGISNYLTGFIFILIAIKAKHLSVYMLTSILAAYALGTIAIRLVGLTRGSNAFSGMYIMMAYLLICLLTVIKYFWEQQREKNMIHATYFPKSADNTYSGSKTAYVFFVFICHHEFRSKSHSHIFLRMAVQVSSPDLICPR
jgi:hypothetical protein